MQVKPAHESELSLPQELLAEVQRAVPVRPGDMHVEGWKPSFMGRMFGFLGGARARE